MRSQNGGHEIHHCHHRVKPLINRHKTLPYRIVIPARLSGGLKPKTEYFRDETAARARVKEIELGGIAAVTGVRISTPPAHAVSLTEHALAELGNDAAAVMQAIREYKSRASLRPATVRQAVEAYLAWHMPRVRRSTYESNRVRLLKLLYALGGMQLTAVNKSALLEFFDAVKGDKRSIYKSVRGFLSWAADYNYLHSAPTIRPPGEYGACNEILSVAEFRRMLRVAAGLEPAKRGGEPSNDYRALLPWFTFAGFAGMRTCEIVRQTRDADALKMPDLYFDRSEPFFHVRASAAKATRRKDGDERYFTGPLAIDAIKAWMPHFPPPRKAGYVSPYALRNVRRIMQRFQAEMVIAVPTNALRNSAISYALCISGISIADLSKSMGNSETVIRRHYLKTLPPDAGLEWFSLRPCA